MVATRSSERNIVLTNQALRALTEINFKRTESLTLWTLANRLPIGGDVVSSAALELEFGIDKSHIAKALKFLSEKGFLLRGVKVGTSRIYKLNPAFFKVLA